MSTTQQHVLITGASGALGSHVVKEFIEAGHRVVGTHAPHERAQALRKDVEWKGLDLSDPAVVAKEFSTDSYDVLVHCAGGFRFAKIDELSDSDLKFLIESNLLSSFWLSRTLIPAMKKKRFGRIVFVSAAATQKPGSGMGAYAASKIGLNALTLSLTEELKDFGINVNAVMPTIIDTPSNRAAMPSADASGWVNPVRLARIIFDLTQEWGNDVRGALLPVAGRVS